MQHPAHTNYYHENAPPGPQTNKLLQRMENKKDQTKIIKVHYIIIIFNLYFLQKHLQHRLQKKRGVGVVCPSVVFIPQ